MQKLGEYCHPAVLKPSLKGSQYQKICTQLEAAVLEQCPSAALQCLEFINSLYPQYPDIVYITALTLYREEKYHEAWQLLMLNRGLPANPLVAGARDNTTTPAAAADRVSCTEHSSHQTWAQSPTANTVIEKDIVKNSLSCSSCYVATRPVRKAVRRSNHECHPVITSDSTEDCTALIKHETSSADNHVWNQKNDPELRNDGTSSLEDCTAPFNGSSVRSKDCAVPPKGKKVFFSGCRDPRQRALLASVVNALVDRWHFPMLNDSARNLAFKRAIQAALSGARQETRATASVIHPQGEGEVMATRKVSMAAGGDRGDAILTTGVERVQMMSRVVEKNSQQSADDDLGSIGYGMDCIDLGENDELETNSTTKEGDDDIEMRGTDNGSCSDKKNIKEKVAKHTKSKNKKRTNLEKKALANTDLSNGSAEHSPKNTSPMTSMNHGQPKTKSSPDNKPNDSLATSSHIHCDELLPHSEATSGSVCAAGDAAGQGSCSRRAPGLLASPGTVLDVGCGSGLLSLYARESGARRVWGCDSSAFMCELAKGVLQVNPPPSTETSHTMVDASFCGVAATKSKGAAHPRKRRRGQDAREGADEHNETSIEVLNLHSKEIDLHGDSSINGRVSLVVTETLDAAVLGERIVDTLSDAWQRLLLPPPGKALNTGLPPSSLCNGNTTSVDSLLGRTALAPGCSLTAVPDRQDIANKTSRSNTTGDVSNGSVAAGHSNGSFLNGTASVDAGVSTPPGFYGKVIPGRVEAYVAMVECDYICRYSKRLRTTLNTWETSKATLAMLPQDDLYTTERLEHLPAGYTELTKWYKVFEMDFNSPADLLESVQAYSKDKLFSLRCDNSGNLDAFVLAFKLFVDEHNCLETFPGSGSCWETAVYPVRCCRTVEEGERLAVALTSSEGEIKMRLVDDDQRLLQVLRDNNDPGATLCRDCAGLAGDSGPCECSNGYSEMLQVDYEAVANPSLSMNNDCSRITSTVSEDLQPNHEQNEIDTPRSNDSRLTVVDCQEEHNPAEDKEKRLKSINTQCNGHSVHPSSYLFLNTSSLRALNSSTYTAALSQAARVIASSFMDASGKEESVDPTLVFSKPADLIFNVPNPANPTCGASRFADPSIEQIQVADHRSGEPVFSVYDETPLPVAALVLCRLLPQVTVTVAEESCKEYLVANGVADAVVVDEDDQLRGPGSQFDAMFMWPVTELGLLQDDLETKRQFCRTRLHARGHVFPGQLDVLATCLDSDQLLTQTRASDSNTAGVTLAALVNMLKTTHQLDVLLDTLPHTQLTQVFSPMSLNFMTGKVSCRANKHSIDKKLDRNMERKWRNNEIREENASTSDCFLIDRYTSEEGWNCAEGRRVVSLHRRGLLCIGRNLFESKVQLEVVNPGHVTGIAHWFGLRGIYDVGNSQIISADDSLRERKGVNFQYYASEGENVYLQQSVHHINTFLNVSECQKNKMSEGSKRTSNKVNSNHSKTNGTSPSARESEVPGAAPLILPTLGQQEPSVQVLTVGEESPCNQACFMVEEPFPVRPRDQLLVDCVYREGCFWLDVDTHTTAAE